MSATTMQQTPAIPPRPARGQESENGPSMPLIPPRPKKLNRSISPNPERFAQSPFNEGFSKQRRPSSGLGTSIDAHERSSSVDLPTLGQEGQEYAAVTEDLGSSPETARGEAGSPEQTRMVAEDLKLHAPKPTMPAQSAKQRVMAVTRTDSDKAASYGIGRPSSSDMHGNGPILRKKASTTSQLSQAESHAEDEQGIPEIGQRVPLIHMAGDVQAPSPAPGSGAETPNKNGRNHTRKLSARSGFESVPPGSYGLHGHGLPPTDKLEKAYYEKHPEVQKWEVYNNRHERVQDFSRSSDELNKIVQDTAGRGAGFGDENYAGTPSEQAGYQASEEYAIRKSTSRPPSAAARHGESVTSPLRNSFTGPEISVDDTDDDGVIHVEDPGHKGFLKYGDETSAAGAGAEDHYDAPILASDEVAKGPSPHDMHAAVEPPAERAGSAFEMDHPRSRPASRPASIYSQPSHEVQSTPLHDVEEYEPLFPEGGKADQKHLSHADQAKEFHRRFPSRDIWEDAPNSVHATAEVSTPEPGAHGSQRHQATADLAVREGETPAQAFARRQEELAEKEDRSPDSFLQRTQRPPSWVEGQPHLSKGLQISRPSSANRFPSRDVWEDTPDSLQFTTTVSTPQQDESEPTSATSEKPAIPARPARKQGSGDDKPAIPDRPKPQLPARPAKAAAGAKDPEAVPKQKPAVPARPAGGKIAALQAGFMSDLNKRLQLGPHAPAKKEEPQPEEPEQKEKAPLSDARKGRARGPQRRAPTKSKSPSPVAAASNGKPVLSFSTTRVLWSIDEEGTMTVDEDIKAEQAKGGSEPVESPVQSKEETQTSEPAEPTASIPADNKATEAATGESTANEATNNTQEETKTLASNTAGESILEETIDKKSDGDQVQAVEEAKDEVVS